MSVALRIDGHAWREHLDEMMATMPGLVPVAKGNGYGFGLDVLARETTRMNADVLAVGVPSEIAVVRAAGWNRDIVVLGAWREFIPGSVESLADPHVITTVGSPDDLELISRHAPKARVLLEVETSIHRHGMPDSQLADAVSRLDDLNFEGWTIHLPMTGNSLVEARALADVSLAACRAPLWLSHLPPSEAAQLGHELDAEIRMRIGTALWLHHPALTTTARVLDVHRVTRGERVGYRQRRVPRAGWVVVVSGGTSHGVALSAPSSATTLRKRELALAAGILDAAGWVISPFTIAGRKRQFIEPPHMQESLVYVPGTDCPVAVGDTVRVQLRLTTSNVDEVIID